MNGPLLDESFAPIVHALGFAVPYLIPSTTVRALCRALKMEVDSGRFFALQYGCQAKAITKRLLSSALADPLARCLQKRLDLGTTSAPTSLEVLGTVCIVGLENGEARIVELSGGDQGLLGGAGGLAGTVIRRVIGHRSMVTCVAVDPVKFMTGSVDRTVKMWSFTSGKLLSVFEHSAPVEVFRCDEPDLLVLCAEKRGGPLALYWHDMYTKRQAAPPLLLRDINSHQDIEAGRAVEARRKAALVWYGVGRRAFIGGLASGSVVMVSVESGAEMRLMRSLTNGHSHAVIEMRLMASQEEEDGDCHRGPAATLVTADIAGDIAVWQLNSPSALPQLIAKRSLDNRACLALDAFGGVQVTSFWGPRLYVCRVQGAKDAQLELVSRRDSTSPPYLRHLLTCLQVQPRARALVVCTADSSLRVILFQPLPEPSWGPRDSGHGGDLKKNSSASKSDDADDGELVKSAIKRLKSVIS